MQYNGLKSNLSDFAKFTYIYETDLKNITGGLAEFSCKYVRAYNIFVENNMGKKMKYASTKEITTLSNSSKDKKYTFHMTRQKFQIWDFCRHLRNSFVHGLLTINGDKLAITDRHNGYCTSTGYMSYEFVKDFIVEIIKEYENSNQ